MYTTHSVQQQCDCNFWQPLLAAKYFQTNSIYFYTVLYVQYIIGGLMKIGHKMQLTVTWTMTISKSVTVIIQTRPNQRANKATKSAKLLFVMYME